MCRRSCLRTAEPWLLAQRMGKCSHSRMPWDIWLMCFVLGLILPWRGLMRMKKLLAMPQVSSAERLALYASTVAFQWVAVAVVAWRAWAPRFTASQLGFTIPDTSRILLAASLRALATPPPPWLNLPRVRATPPAALGPFPAPPAWPP